MHTKRSSSIHTPVSHMFSHSQYLASDGPKDEVQSSRCGRTQRVQVCWQCWSGSQVGRLLFHRRWEQRGGQNRLVGQPEGRWQRRLVGQPEGRWQQGYGQWSGAWHGEWWYHGQQQAGKVQRAEHCWPHGNPNHQQRSQSSKHGLQDLSSWSYQSCYLLRPVTGEMNMMDSWRL
jgi:hypothetical protein